MTLQPWGAVLLVSLVLLLGLLIDAAARNVLDRAVQSKLRQDKDRRKAWPTACASFQQPDKSDKCPYCASPWLNGTRTSRRRSSRNNTATERLRVHRNQASHPPRREQNDQRRAEQ